LIEWGFASFEWREVIGENPVQSVKVKYGSGADSVNLRPESALSLLLKKSTPDSDIEKIIHINATETTEDSDSVIAAPVTKGEVLGEVIVYLEGKELGRVTLTADSSIAKAYSAEIRDTISAAFKSSAVRWMIAGAAFLILLYIAYLIFFGVKSAKRARAKLAAANRLAEARRERENQAAMQFEQDGWENCEADEGFGYIDDDDD